MSEWNSFSRVEAVLNHEIPDRVPKYEGTIEIKELNPFINGQEAPTAILYFPNQILNIFHRFPAIFSLIEKIIKHPRLLYPVARVAPRFASSLHRKFNYDIYPYISGFPMIFRKRIFRDFHTEEKNRVIKDRTGRLIWRSSPDGAHARFGFMQAIEDWEKYMEFDADHPANYFLVEPAMNASKNMGIVPQFVVFGAVGFEDLCGMFGFEKIFELLISEKNFIKTVVKEMNDYAITVAEGIIQRGGKFLYISSDLGLLGRSMISPRMFKELFKPTMKKFCRRVHQLGGKIMLHSCGNVVKLMPDLVDTGIDALHPIESTAGNDIVEFKKQYGKKLVLVGNVPIPLLTHGTPKENYEYVKYLLKNVSKDGGHIISSSHSITQWCKLKNYYAYLKAVEDHGKYPIHID